MMMSKDTMTFVPYTVIFSVVCAVASFDIYAPCMPLMMKSFGCSAGKVQLSIGIGALGGALFTLFIGPFSDHYGRRKIMVFSMLFYALVSLIIPFVGSVESFLALRFLQGMSGASPMVVGFAIIKDVYQGKAAVKYFSYLSTSVTTTLIFAPLLGGYFAKNMGWESSFTTLGMMSGLSAFILYQFLPETLSSHSQTSIKMAYAKYLEILKTGEFIILAFIPAFMITGMISFVTNAPFYFINELNIPPDLFGVYQSVIMAFNTLMSALSNTIIRKIGEKKTVSCGLSLFATGAVMFTVTSYFGYSSAAMVTVWTSMYAGGIGLIFGPITSRALEKFPSSAGAASSILSLLRGILIMALVPIGSSVYNNTAFSIAIFLSGIMLIVLALIVVERKKPHWR